MAFDPNRYRRITEEEAGELQTRTSGGFDPSRFRRLSPEEVSEYASFADGIAEKNPVEESFIERVRNTLGERREKITGQLREDIETGQITGRVSFGQ